MAVLGATGSLDRMTAAGDVAPGEIIVTNGLASDIKDRVNAIYSRVVGIASRVNIVPVKTNVVALIDKLTNAIPLDQTGERITDVGEELQDFADEIRARRQGLPEFVGNDCDAMSDCGRFRQDLGRMFDNLERVGYAIQQMVCSEIPNIQTRTIEFPVVRNILVENDRAPKIVLFLMSRILEQVNGWQLEGLVGTLPMEALEVMCIEARGTNASFSTVGAQVVRTSGKNAVCTALRPKPIGGALKRTAARVGVLDWSVKQLDALFPEDKTVGVAVIAVGGGGFSVTRKGVPATLSEILIANFGTMKSLLEKVEARREACLGDEERWEKDLYTCRPKIEYLTNDTNVLRDLFGLVQRQANAIGKNEKSRANQSRTARRKAEAWFAEDDFRKAYGCVCSAYQKLVVPDPRAAYTCS